MWTFHLPCLESHYRYLRNYVGREQGIPNTPLAVVSRVRKDHVSTSNDAVFEMGDLIRTLKRLPGVEGSPGCIPGDVSGGGGGGAQSPPIKSLRVPWLLYLVCCRILDDKNS
jgi:hypothetical protein